MKKLIIQLISCYTLLIFSNEGYSQKRLLNWYIGTQVGLEFDCDLKVKQPALNKILIAEGSTCVSDDDNGTLLFYVNPSIQAAPAPDTNLSKKVPGIYDASHTRMPNGQMPYINSPYQGVVTFPIGNSSYYVFYLSEGTGPQTGITNTPGLKYSVVDMTLPGNGTVANPLGDVDPARKRIYVDELSASAVTAVRHSNGKDYWVVGAVAKDTIHAYRVSAAGVDPPVVTGGMINLSDAHNMKFSSDGRKFASFFIVADFDPTTGVFTNPFNISTVISGPANLTVGGSSNNEFSPNCNYLFKFGVKRSNAWTSVPYLYRYNTANYSLPPDEFPVVPTGSTTPGPQRGYFHGDMQLHIDGNIYYSRYPKEAWPGTAVFPDALSAIINPNNPTPTFVPEAVLITFGRLNEHVPNFITSWAMEVDAENIAETLVSSSCANESYTFKPETCGLVTTYDWIFGDGGASTQQNPSHTYTVSGNYTVQLIVTNNKTCSPWNTDTITKMINVSLSSSVTVGPTLNLNCTNPTGTITASSTTPNVTYSWSGPGVVSGGTTNTATVITAGIYTVTITDPASGCITSTSVTVTSNITNPTVVAGPPLVLTSCISSTGTISASSSTPNVSYAWTGTGIVSGGSTNNPTVNSVGTYTVTVTDPITGCTASTTILVTSSISPPTVVAGAPLVLTSCISSTGTISASSSTPNVTYAWTGTGIVSGGSTNNPTVNGTGTYTVTVTDPTTGCTASTTILVTSSISPPTVVAGAPLVLTSCISSTGTISASSSTPNVTYAWTGTGIVSGGSTNNPTVNAPGTYTVTVTDPTTGCTASTTILVTSSVSPPTVTAGPPLVLTSCISSTGTISASSSTPNVSYTWTGTGIVSGGSTNNPTVSSVGTYTVTVTSPATGCTATATVAVTSNINPPTLLITPLLLHCKQTSGPLTATSNAANATYAWSGPGIVSGGTTNSPTVNTAGTYAVTVTDGSTGCTTTSSQSVTASPDPTATISASILIQVGQTTTIAASGGGTYSWIVPSNYSLTTTSTLAVQPILTTTYCVQVSDANGCKDTACTIIYTEVPCPKNVKVGIPNAFSPNGDNTNDVFCLQGWTSCNENFSIVIYNRWGENVYESTDPQFCWDGSYKGVIMNTQVFVYIIKATFEDDTEPFIRKGNVSLIK